MSHELNRRQLMIGVGIAAALPIEAQANLENQIANQPLDGECRTINAQGCMFSLNYAFGMVNELLQRGYRKRDLSWHLGVIALTSLENIFACCATNEDLIEAMKCGVPEALNGVFLGIPFFMDLGDPHALVIRQGKQELSKLVGVAIPSVLGDKFPQP